MSLNVLEFDAKGKALSRELLHEETIVDLLNLYPVVIIHNDRFLANMGHEHVLLDKPQKKKVHRPQFYWWHRDVETELSEKVEAYDALVLHSKYDRTTSTVVCEEAIAMNQIGNFLRYTQKNFTVNYSGEASPERLLKELKNLKQNGGTYREVMWGLKMAEDLFSCREQLSYDQQTMLLNATGFYLGIVTRDRKSYQDAWTGLARAPGTAEIFYRQGDTVIIKNSKPHVHGRVSPTKKVGVVNRRLVRFDYI